MKTIIADKQFLKVGDIVAVSNAIMGLKEYPVMSIIGNKAITAFRIFNKRIYPGGNIYEYGKSVHDWSNGYWLKGTERKGRK